MAFCRVVVTQGIEQRSGRKMPHSDTKAGEDDRINKGSDYFGKVFDQTLNIWQTNDKIKQLMLDERIDKMAVTLAGWNGIRIDSAFYFSKLFKRKMVFLLSIIAPMWGI